MATVVDLKNVLPPAPPQGLSFNELYDAICNNIRAQGTTQTIMDDFQKLLTDLDRVTYVNQFPELFEFEVNENFSEKKADDAASFESVYNMLIPAENSAHKAHEVIMKALQKTPMEDKRDMAVRYMKRAWSHLLLEDFDSATIDALRSQTYNVPNTTIWNSYEILGYCYARKKDYKSSERQFLLALEHLRGSGVSNELKATVTGRIMTVFKTVKTSKSKKSKDSAKENHKEILKIPAVSYGVHKTLENGSAALDVFTIEGRGRCVIANRNIKPGDILIVDKPYVNVLNEDHYTSHCLHCFKRCFTPIPCTYCSKVWFCDEKCRDESWSSIHCWECKVLNHLNDPALGKMTILVFRILITLSWENIKKNRAIMEEKIQEMTELNNSPKEESIMDEPVREAWNWKGVYSHRDYNTVFNLVTNDTKRSFGDLFKRSLAAIYVMKCLKVVNYFDKEHTEDDELFVASLILRHMQSCSCNAYEISEYEIGDTEIPQSSELGGAIYSTISLTNHSCFPNTARYNIGKCCVLRATRSIAAGEEVLDNYGYLFNTNEISLRTNGLQNQYKFECSCLACSSFWDIYPHNENETFFFKCPGPNCKKPVPYSDISFIECPECGNKQQFGKMIKDISKQMDFYNEAMHRIQSTTEDRNKALKILLEHQIFLDKVAVPPCSHFTDNQEAIGFCYNFLGNLFVPKKKESEMENQTGHSAKTINLKKKDKKKYVYQQ